MTQIRQTRRAREDLLDIWAEIASNDMAAADRQLVRIADRILTLKTFLEVGPMRPEIASDARALTVGSYLVLYRIEGSVVRVVRVLHGARDLTPSLFAEGVSNGDV